MGAFKILNEEHLLFQQLIARLEHCFHYEEEEARAEFLRLCLVLLPALKRHEEIEDLIFRVPARRRHGGAAPLDLIEEQHRRLAALREELAVVVAAEHEHDFKRLKPLVLGFCEDLRAHFHSEESLLWPRYDQPGRRLEPALDARARLQVRRLKRDIQRTWLASSDYVGQGR